jgi:alcohol dehydrogenase
MNEISLSVPRTILGLGAINSLGDEASSFSATNTLILTDPGIVKTGVIDKAKLSMEKANLSFEVFDGCKEEPPIPTLREISEKVKEKQYDLLIGIGGGSVMDTTKIASTALSNDSLDVLISTRNRDKIKGRIIPKILVPTTSGTGSDWSPMAAVYDHEGNKTYVVRAWEILANVVIIDPELTAGMPKRVTASTGLDALCHAIESYTSARANVFSEMLAGTAIKLIFENLRQAYSKGQLNLEARYNMSIAAAMAMNAMSCSGGGLSHYTSEFLGPKAHVPHGVTLSTTLPAVMEYNMIANPDQFAKLAELMGENTTGLTKLEAAAKAVAAVRRLLKDLELPQRITEIGIKETDIPEIAQRCYETTKATIAKSNPRDANEEDIIHLLRACI